MRFQSTLSMRRATIRLIPPEAAHDISIHALHEESDPATANMLCANCRISIHALHEESDSYDVVSLMQEEFQSTLSMRRATWA